MFNNFKRTLAGIVMALTPYVANAQAPTFKDVELITPEEAQIKYGNTLPIDVYTSLDTFFNEVNGSTEPLRANVESGTFSSSQGYIARKPFAIKGKSASEVTINSFILGTEYTEIENIKSNGGTDNVTGNDLQAFAAFLRGGKMENCDLYDRAIIGIDPSYDFILQNNTFNAVQSITDDVAVTFTSLAPTVQKGNIIASYNDFYDVHKIFFLIRSVQAGVNISGTGNNYFENCTTVVFNPHGYDVDINLSGNAWADSILARGTQPSLIIDEQYILDNKIINLGTGTINISNPLDYNPMQFRDRDSDGETDYFERDNGTDEFNPLSKSSSVPISSPLSLILTMGLLSSAGYFVSKKVSSL